MLLPLSQSLQSVIGRTKFYLLDRYYIRTIRAMLVAACLIAVVLSTVMLYKKPLLGAVIIAAFMGAGVVVAIYRNMELAAFGLLVTTTILNFSVGTGTGTPITLPLIMLLLLLGLWWFRMLVVERSFASIRPSVVNLPAFLFMIVAVISLFWSGYYVEHELRYVFADKINPRAMTALVLIVSPMASLFYASQMRSLQSKMRFVWWFILFGAIMLPIRLFMTAIPLDPIVNIRGQFPAWVAVIGIGQALFNKQLSPSARLLAGFAGGGWLFVQVIIGINWLSGWIPVVVGLVAMFFLYSRRLFFLAVALAMVVVVIKLDDLNDVVEAENQESGVTRLDAGQHSFAIFERHFLFGTGPAGYHYYLDGAAHLSHNNYLDILSQTGVVGFALYILMWLLVGWSCLKAFLTSPPDTFQSGLSAALISGWCVTMLVMALGDWVTPFPYTQTLAGISYTIWPWLLAGLAIGIYADNRQQAEAQAVADSTQQV